LAERWREPVRPLKVEQLNQALWLPDGRVHGEVQLTLRHDDVMRMRQGYVCAKCLEPHERPWPERCQACGAPMRSEQAAYFEHEFGGLEPTSTRLPWEQEIGTLDERRRKEDERARNDGQLRG
jgi:hypothetical protein